MSLDKAIKHNKEKRKQYRHAQRVSQHCRNHGGKQHKNRNPWECEYCKNNRLYTNRRNLEQAKYQED